MVRNPEDRFFVSRPKLFHAEIKTYSRAKILQYCTCAAGWVTYNFHLSCKHMHSSLKIVCNKEYKGVISNLLPRVILPKELFLQDKCFGKNYSSFLDFTIKAAYSVTLNIFWIFFFVFKSFVKVEVSYVFTIEMFSTAENCMEKWIILSNRCVFLLLVIICVPPIILDRWILT